MATAERRVFAAAVAAAVGAFLLILAGGLVTSRDAGLAVPDWPLAFGRINPPGWWRVENVRTEHGHRLLAFLVACWTAVLLYLVRRHDSRPLARRLALGAAALVIVQALLGGLRVLHLSVDLAMVHGVVGQIFFASIVAVATVTSPGWRMDAPQPPLPRERTMGVLLVAVIFVQLVLGLLIRHLGAAARPLGDQVLFYAHIVVAGLVLSIALDGAATSRSPVTGRALVALVSAQLVLGIATAIATDDMVYERQVTYWEAWLPTFHVGLGALLLGASVANALRTWRDLAPLDSEALPAAEGYVRP